MFYRFLICSFFIIGSLSLPVDREGSGEGSKCECPGHGNTSTTVAPDEDFCQKYCNVHKPATTTVATTTISKEDFCQKHCNVDKPGTTTVATTTVSKEDFCQQHCNTDKPATTTVATTTVSTTNKKPCCCCHGHGTICKPPHGIDMIPGVCPDGWIRFQHSCYFIENKKMSFTEAQKSCVGKGGTLFVADSLEEFNKVMEETTPYYWSWIGLGQSEMNSVPKWGVVEHYNPSTFRCLPLDNSKPPSFGGYGGVDPSCLKWLINPFSSIANGWSPVATCVGYYNGGMFWNYLYFYPCSSQFYSVCERNSTLM